MTAAGLLSGSRILVVEDEMMLAMLIEDMLGDFGCEIVGPAASAAAALALMGAKALDAAVIDVNLRGKKSYAVVDALKARGLPFVFLTGCDAGPLQGLYPNSLVVPKPILQIELELALEKALTVRAFQ